MFRVHCSTVHTARKQNVRQTHAVSRCFRKAAPLAYVAVPVLEATSANNLKPCTNGIEGDALAQQATLTHSAAKGRVGKTDTADRLFLLLFMLIDSFSKLVRMSHKHAVSADSFEVSFSHSQYAKSPFSRENLSADFDFFQQLSKRKTTAVSSSQWLFRLVTIEKKHRRGCSVGSA